MEQLPLGVGPADVRQQVWRKRLPVLPNLRLLCQKKEEQRTPINLCKKYYNGRRLKQGEEEGKWSKGEGDDRAEVFPRDVMSSF